MDKRRSCLLALYAVGHFLVDLICAFGMLHLVQEALEVASLCLLLYNFCAFALQMPFGLAADRLDRNATVAVVGLALAFFAFAFFSLPLLCAILLGLGNCLYHVGGGVDVLHFSDRQQWMLGVYVSPGAIGLLLGGFLAKQGQLSLPVGVLSALLLAAAVAVGVGILSPLRRPSGNGSPDITPSGRAPILAVLALLLVVVLRSYAGLTMTFPWKKDVLAVVAVLALACGKAAGGFLADLVGEVRASVLSLTLCAVLLTLSQWPVCGLLAIFLFNMTMPLTLFAMARLFPHARGFAFGILTFALFLGYLPIHFSLPSPHGGEGWRYGAEAILSLLLMTVGLWACREKKGDLHE